MKKLLYIVAAAALLSGCRSSQPSPAPVAVSNSQSQTNSVPAPKPKKVTMPKVGMTKADIRKMYGRPMKVLYTESGDQWEYDNRRKFWIPFYFNYTLHVQMFNFDTNGVLVSFIVDHK